MCGIRCLFRGNRVGRQSGLERRAGLTHCPSGCGHGLLRQILSFASIFIHRQIDFGIGPDDPDLRLLGSGFGRDRHLRGSLFVLLRFRTDRQLCGDHGHFCCIMRFQRRFAGSVLGIVHGLLCFAHRLIVECAAFCPIIPCFFLGAALDCERKG